MCLVCPNPKCHQFKIRESIMCIIHNRTDRTGLTSNLAAPRPLTSDLRHFSLQPKTTTKKKISPHTHVLLSLCLQLK